MKIHAPSGHERPAHRHRRGQGERVAIVHVDDVRSERGGRASQVPPGPRVEPDLPAGSLHGDASGTHATRQLTAVFGDEDLLDPGVLAELAA